MAIIGKWMFYRSGSLGSKKFATDNEMIQEGDEFFWKIDYNGNFTGTAHQANRLGSLTVGGITKPIYLNAGKATVCSDLMPKSGGTFSGAVVFSSTVTCKSTLKCGEYIKSSKSAYSHITSYIDMAATSTQSGVSGAICIRNSSGIHIQGNIVVIEGNTSTPAAYEAGYHTTETGNMCVRGKFLCKNVIGSSYMYNHDTVSSGANVYVTSNGWLRRATSSAKYKLDIKEIEEDEKYPYKILNLKPKQWFDKNSIEKYSQWLEGKIKKDELDDCSIDSYYGLIAEDVEKVGLNKFCFYGYDNARNLKTIEGIQYDRLPILFIPILNDCIDCFKAILPTVKENIKDKETLDKIASLEDKFNSIGLSS